MPRKETPDDRRERRAREADKKRAEEAEQGITRRPRGRAREGQQWDEQLGEWVPTPTDAPAPAMAPDSAMEDAPPASEHVHQPTTGIV